MNDKIIPFGERILVEPVIQDEKSKGGIFIPDAAKEKPQLCTIKKLGTGKLTRDINGKIHTEPFIVKEGQKIIVSKYGGVEVESNGNKYKLIIPEDILAIVES